MSSNVASLMTSDKPTPGSAGTPVRFGTVETLKVALVLCLVCSVAVSTTVVLLKERQESNKAEAMRAQILSAAGLLEPGQDINRLFEEKIDTRLVDLATGEYVDTTDPATYDQRAAARDPATSTVVLPKEDIASIKRRANYAPVYLVGDTEDPQQIIVPVHGYGLWSTMYALVALGGEGNEIRGVRFYEQLETAGLGAEVENPRWQDLWVGKRIFDESGDVAFAVVKGGVDTSSPNAVHQVDALAGATLTSDGVTNMIRYWMSDQGFGKYLARFR